MPEKTEITAQEYEEFKRLKKFENEINENYYNLYLQILHMQLLVLAYFDNEADHHLYNTDDIFNLIFNACCEMYSSALKIQNTVYQEALRNPAGLNPDWQ